MIFQGISEGVRAIHECGYAHRDLKTGNVCFTESMEPVLVDFGSSTEARVEICGQSDAMKLQDEAEEKCSLCYRAPELFQVESYAIIDERTDIWSLGCVLFALCFFKSPYDAVYERGDSVSLAVLSGKIPFPENSPYSQELHELMLFQLKTNPMERPFVSYLNFIHRHLLIICINLETDIQRDREGARPASEDGKSSLNRSSHIAALKPIPVRQ